MSRLALACVLALTLPAACGGKPAGDQQDAEAKKDGPPVYSGTTLDSQSIALADLRGKVVLLNVWATWCAPCRQELPELVALHDKHGDDDFTVLGVSVDARVDLKKVDSAVRFFKLDYPIIFDPGGDVISTFDVTGYPTSFLIGKDGNVRWRRNGIIAPDDPELQAQLSAALAQ